MAPIWSLLPIELSEPLRWEILEQPVLPTRAEPPSKRLSPLTSEEVDSVVNHISVGSLSKRQQSFAQGGLTVNTAFVPPYDDTNIWVNVDSVGQFNCFVGYSLSNVLQLQFTTTSHSQVPESSLQSDEAYSSLRIGAKAVPFSPLHQAPFWGGGRITMSTKRSYFSISDDISFDASPLFAEVMATFEFSPSWAFNFNPKIAVGNISNMWALGFSSNYQLTPSWQFLAEANLRPENLFQSNGTVALRWQPFDSIMVDFYGSTADSISELGQFSNSGRVYFGTRLFMSF